MYWDVISVKILDNYKIKVKFSNNLEDIIDIDKKWLTGVFAPLIDLNIFKMAYTGKESGAVTWNN